MPQPTFHTWIDTIAVQYIQKWCKCLSLLEMTTFLETEGFSKCLTTVWHPSALVSRSRYWRKSKQKVFANVWLLTAPQPQVHTLHRWVAQTGHLWQQLRIQPRHIKPYFFICKFANQTFSLTPMRMYGITKQHTCICKNCNLTDLSF